MSTNKKSGWTEEDRLRFLRDNGFTEVRNGKGSHTVWEHAELKEMSKSRKIEAPANLLSTPGQKPWDLPMCHNPASGTWHSIQKQVEWCSKTVKDLKDAQKKKEHHNSLKVMWRLARREICAWKKEQKNWLKAGLPISGLSAPPESYHQYEQIREAVRPAFVKNRDPFVRG